MFSTSVTTQNDSLLFEDPHAIKLSVGCSSIPRATGDLYNATIYFEGTCRCHFQHLPNKRQKPDHIHLISLGLTLTDWEFVELAFNLQSVIDVAKEKRIIYQNTQAYTNDDNRIGFSIGGEKPSKDSPPNFRREFVPVYLDFVFATNLNQDYPNFSQ